MNKETKIKYLDFVISKIEDTDMFGIYSILSENKEIKESELPKAAWNVEKFAETYDLIEKYESGFFKLSKKGNELKDFKKGFVKFEKKAEKPPLSLFEILSILGFLITFSYALYQNNQSNTLGNQQTEFQIELDSLKTEFLLLNYEIDSLKHQLNINYKSE